MLKPNDRRIWGKVRQFAFVKAKQYVFLNEKPDLKFADINAG